MLNNFGEVLLAPQEVCHTGGVGSFAQIIQHSKSENFSFISAGTRASNPSELLAQAGFKDLLTEALSQFDQVVIDSAPVHPVSDTLLLAPRVKTVCLVVRADRTPKRAALTALKKLQNARSQVAGFILNGISPLHRREYYDYSDYYARYGEKETAASPAPPAAPSARAAGGS